MCRLTTEYFRSLDYFSRHQGASPTHKGESQSDQTNIKLLINKKLVATQEVSMQKCVCVCVWMAACVCVTGWRDARQRCCAPVGQQLLLHHCVSQSM